MVEENKIIKLIFSIMLHFTFITTLHVPGIAVYSIGGDKSTPPNCPRFILMSGLIAHVHVRCFRD